MQEKFTFEKDENGRDTFSFIGIQDFLWDVNTIGVEKGKNRNVMCGQAIRLYGGFNLDAERMERAVQKLYDTDDALRTILVEEDGKVMQKVVSNYKYKLEVKEVEGENAEIRYKNALQTIDDLIEVPLTVFNQIMSRFDFYKIDDGDYVFAVYVSHMLTDGIGISVLINKLFKYYDDITEENKSMSYSEYRHYEETVLSSEEGRNHLKYWSDKMVGYTPFELINDGTEKAGVDLMKPSTMFFDKKTLDRTAHKYKSGNFMLLLTAYHLMLSKYYKATDTAIGVAFANRRNPAFTHTIGLLLKAVISRVIIKPEDTFRDIMSDMVKNSDEDARHQEFAIDGYKMKFMVTQQRETSALQRFSKISNKIEFPYIDFNRNLSGMFNLLMLINEIDDKVMVVFSGDSSVFSEKCILKMKEYFQEAVNEIINNPDGNVSGYLKIN